MDLTKNTTPLGLLAPEDRKALMAQPWDQIEVYSMSGWSQLKNGPIWVDTATYRVRREPRRSWIVGNTHAFDTMADAEAFRAATNTEDEIIEVIEIVK